MNNDELMAEIARSNAMRAGGEGMYYRDEGGTFRLDYEANVPPLPPEETSIWDDIGSAFDEVGSQIHDFGKGIGVGWEKGQTNILKDIPFFEGLTFNDGRPVENLSHLGEWADEQLGTQIEVGEPEGVAGMIGEGLGQFLPGYIPATKFLRMTGLFNKNNLLGRVARETVAGAIGDFGTSSDEEAEALLGMLSMIPEEYGGDTAKDIAQTLTDWMEGEDGDTDELRGRLVASIPGAVLTGPLEALMSLAGVAWRSGKNSRQAFARGIKNWWENPQPMQGMYTGIPFPMGHNRPPADMRLEVETPEAPRTDIDEEGFYSAARRAAENLPDKGSPREMLALLKNPEKVGERVKDDELKWTGLIESRVGVAQEDHLAPAPPPGLLDDPDLKSITRDEILAHLDSHQVRVKTQDVSEVGSENYEAMTWGDPTPDLDPEYIASRVDDEIYEIERMTTDNELNSYQWQGVRDGLKERDFTSAEIDELETFILQHNRLPTTAARQRGHTDIYDILTKIEEENYRADPYWQTWRTDEGYEIYGGVDVGYTVHNPEGGRVAADVEDLDEAMQAADLHAMEQGGGTPQDLFEGWTVKAGDEKVNYRVMTIDLDDVDQSPIVTSSRDFGTTGGGHFFGNNQLLHVRMSDRMVDGKKVLFIEEIQSDPARKDDLVAPDGLPFLGEPQKYAGLAVKRMMALAAKEGYDRVAWTTGAQQADLYNLAKFIDRIELSPGGNFRAYDKDAREIISRTGVDDALLDDLIGKANADRLRAVEPNPPHSPASRPFRRSDDHEFLKNARMIQPGARVLESADMEIGGEFHKMLYDKIIPKEFKAALKNYQKKPKVGRGSIDTNYRTTLGVDGQRDLRYRAGQLLDDDPVENRYLVEAFYNLADAGPDADIDEFLKTIDPDLHADIGNTILGYTPRSKRPPAEVHVIELDEGLRKKIIKRGVPMFTAPAAVAGAAGGASLVSSPSEAGEPSQRTQAMRLKGPKVNLPVWTGNRPGAIVKNVDEPTRRPAKGRK